MSRFVSYDRTGGTGVLRLGDVSEPHAGPGQVRVRVVTAGLNPVDWKIFTGHAKGYAAPLPAGVGNDFAGVVDEIGDGVTEWSAGDEVFGGARHRAMADFIVAAPSTLRRKPATLDWLRAGSFDIAGRTAAAVIAAILPTAEDTVLVSAAAGGVGVIVAQLAMRSGARVIGTASEQNHDFLRGLGVIPVAYGPGLAGRIRESAPSAITAVADQHGRDTLELALQLGVPPHRVNTIAAKPFGTEHGFGTDGGGEAKDADVERVIELAAAGELVLPIDSEYPLERVREAYDRQMGGHLRGKIVIRMN